MTCFIITCIFILFHAALLTRSYEVQMNNVIKMGENLINDAEVNTKNLIRNLPKKITNFNQLEMNSIDSDLKISVGFLIDHVTSTGVKMLGDEFVNIKKQLKIIDTFKSVYQKSIANYLQGIEQYTSFIVKQKTECFLDKEMIILDMVVSCNKLLYNAVQQLLTDITANNNSTILEEDIEKISKVSKRHYKQNVMKDMEYICLELNTCRKYPGFLDSSVELINAMMKLSNVNLEKLISKIRIIVARKRDALAKFIDNYALNVASDQLDLLTNNLPNTKLLLNGLRLLIMQRRKFIVDETAEEHRKTKAIRLLMDIIDKSFEDVQEEVIKISYSNVINAMTDWDTGDVRDVGATLDGFIAYVIEIVKFNSTPDAKREINALIEFVSRGEAKQKILCEHLLSKGSQYLRRASIFPWDKINIDEVFNHNLMTSKILSYRK